LFSDPWLKAATILNESLRCELFLCVCET
jgi:hypothetical protein